MAPPMPASALQPPAPGQYFGNRPSFSYNVAPHVNARLPTGQQFQLDTGTNHAGQVPRFIPPGSLQPPAPGQLARPNAAFPGALAPNSTSTTISSSGSTSIHIQMPTNQSVAPRPEAFGAIGPSVPGQPSAVFSNAPSLLGRPIVQSASPLPQTTQSVATPGVIPQNSRPQIYPSYSSTPGAIPPQPLWGHPHPQQPTGFPQASFQSYSAGPAGLVRPMFGTSTVTTSLPAGVTAVGDQKDQALTNPGSEQPIHLSAEPPSTGNGSQVNEKRNSGAQDSDAWSAHKTETGAVYYYNALTGESTYHRPPGYKGEPDKVATQPVPVSWDKLAGTDWSIVTTSDGKKYYYDNKQKVSSWQLPPEVAEILKHAESGSVKESSTSLQDAATVENKGVMSIDTSTPAAQTGCWCFQCAFTSCYSICYSDDEEHGPSKEDCICQFKEMLKERGVAPFSKWEKELPKIVFDPRFKAIPSHSTRRTIFDHYVRTRAEEERKEKKAAQKAAVEAYKQLLEEASKDINSKTDYQEFKRKWGADPRFEALDRKEREALFNEKVKAVQEKILSTRKAFIVDFKSMLRESKEITSTSRWIKVKENFRNDSRYKAVTHEERESIFNEYIAELKSAEQEAEQAAKAKVNEQAKLRERERETRKRKEREEQEMERVKLKIRRKEAVSSYQALLVEMIKDPKASWTESKPKLEKDPQGRAVNPDLGKGDAEKLFRDHVKDLYERRVRDFRALLSEVITPEAAMRATDEGKTAVNSWTEAKGLLRSDPRYNKLASKDRESIWRRYADDLTRKLKQSDTKEKSDTDKLVKIELLDRSLLLALSGLCLGHAGVGPSGVARLGAAVLARSYKRSTKSEQEMRLPGGALILAGARL
ncbi:hypothetical protein QOZ80_2BG0183970 [Eleusine coracana subsp. coracana]|nr:hypothetical protein QOZ80_2BG0183970 [Eleusine coracana subsp. coracana]